MAARGAAAGERPQNRSSEKRTGASLNPRLGRVRTLVVSAAICIDTVEEIVGAEECRHLLQIAVATVAIALVASNAQVMMQRVRMVGRISLAAHARGDNSTACGWSDGVNVMAALARARRMSGTSHAEEVIRTRAVRSGATARGAVAGTSSTTRAMRSATAATSRGPAA